MGPNRIISVLLQLSLRKFSDNQALIWEMQNACFNYYKVFWIWGGFYGHEQLSVVNIKVKMHVTLGNTVKGQHVCREQERAKNWTMGVTNFQLGSRRSGVTQSDRKGSIWKVKKKKKNCLMPNQVSQWCRRVPWSTVKSTTYI